MRAAGVALAVLLGGLVVVPAASAETPSRPSDLDVLFVGAHPDDEAGLLSSIGQWNTDHELRTGVVTITRGEGGGNAVGPEEGPDLGRLREAEERRAVGKAGVTDVFNLDKVDFYYTVSSPLTELAWDHDDTLERLTRVVRQTRPAIVVTMDPAPSPGNHGNHQYAARLAAESYYAAADRNAFPGQLRGEGLRTWAPAKLFTSGLDGDSGVGQGCETEFTPDRPSDRVWGVWAGRPASDGQHWAQVERAAQREYASQGWAGFPDVPTDPAEIGCDYLTQVASRVPYRQANIGVDGILEGALLAGPLPLGTTFTATADRYLVTPGSTVTVTAEASVPGELTLTPPPGWTVTGSSGQFAVTVADDAAPGPVRLPVTLNGAMAEAVVEVVPPVHAAQQALPQVAQYREWANAVGHPELGGLVAPVLTLASGGARDIDVTVRNDGDSPRSGTVELVLPEGFQTDGSGSFADLAPGGESVVTFPVSNTDPSLPTGMTGGDYAYDIVVTSDGQTAISSPALELVPSTTIAQAGAAPTVDGAAGEGEYPGAPLDASPQWEGEDCESTADCAASAALTWHEETLYALVNVTDDTMGSILSTSDCKRHWRTDSVELTFDPKGNSENTSSTYKLAALPVTTEGPACALRDADNNQGDAPGVQVAATVTDTGYTLEVAVPIAALPGSIDPAAFGMNVLVYDSDTQDKAGQTRIGWSTWGGVQGDPYRWGRATLDGYQPGEPTDPPEPTLPLDALSSVDSPQTLEQSVRLGLPPGGAAPSLPIRVVPGLLLSAEAGTAYVYAGEERHVIQVRPGVTRIPHGSVLVGFINAAGKTAAAAS